MALNREYVEEMQDLALDFVNSEVKYANHCKISVEYDTVEYKLAQAVLALAEDWHEMKMDTK
jgi:hypothetical protein